MNWPFNSCEFGPLFISDTYQSKMLWAAELWPRSSGSGSHWSVCCLSEPGRAQRKLAGRGLYKVWCPVVNWTERRGVWRELSGSLVWDYLETQSGRFGMQHWCWFWRRSDWSWREWRCCWTSCCWFGWSWRRSCSEWMRAFGFHVPDPCLPVASVSAGRLGRRLHRSTRRGRAAAGSVSIWTRRVCQTPC